MTSFIVGCINSLILFDTFSHLDNHSILSFPTDPSDIDALYKYGEHCTYEYCKQLDYLPFTCDYCQHKFCSSHSAPKSHECPKYVPIELQNTMPKCPICQQYVRLKANEPPDRVVDNHIASGCKTGLLIDPEEKRKLRESLLCSAKGCLNHKRNKYSTVICKKCAIQVCTYHAFPDDHQCTGIQSNPKPHRTSQIIQKPQASVG